MASFPARPLNERTGNFRGRVIAIYILLLLINLAAWGWAIATFYQEPVLLGTALIAYGFGLRHAVDADHIAAIDNVTRKLTQEGKRPVSVGLFFALGHSTIVILVAALIAVSTMTIQGTFENFKEVGGMIATGVSSIFLFVIAAINLTVLIGLWNTYRKIRNGGIYEDTDLDMLLNQRGLLSRLLRPLFQLITQSWHMLPLGFLFGLGFDTATEVSLLGISATQAAQGVSIWAILVFPALFAAGMTLVDTTDGILMLGAYNWAFVKPMRKLYYNLTITSMSVVVAIIIGAIESLGLISKQLGLTGALWDDISLLNANFNSLGFIIVGLFLASWLISAIIYWFKKLDDVEILASR